MKLPNFFRKAEPTIEKPLAPEMDFSAMMRSRVKNKPADEQWLRDENFYETLEQITFIKTLDELDTIGKDNDFIIAIDDKIVKDNHFRGFLEGFDVPTAVELTRPLSRRATGSPFSSKNLTVAQIAEKLIARNATFYPAREALHLIPFPVLYPEYAYYATFVPIEDDDRATNPDFKGLQWYSILGVGYAYAMYLTQGWNKEDVLNLMRHDKTALVKQHRKSDTDLSFTDVKKAHDTYKQYFPND